MSYVESEKFQRKVADFQARVTARRDAFDRMKFSLDAAALAGPALSPQDFLAQLGDDEKPASEQMI